MAATALGNALQMGSLRAEVTPWSMAAGWMLC